MCKNKKSRGSWRYHSQKYRGYGNSALPLWIRLSTSWHVIKCHHVRKSIKSRMKFPIFAMPFLHLKMYHRYNNVSRNRLNEDHVFNQDFLNDYLKDTWPLRPAKMTASMTFMQFLGCRMITYQERPNKVYIFLKLRTWHTSDFKYCDISEILPIFFSLLGMYAECSRLQENVYFLWSISSRY